MGKTNRQLPVSPQESYSYTTPSLNVTASVPDGFVKPASPPLSGATTELLNALAPMVAIAKEQKVEQKEKDKTAGAASAAKGEAAPSGASEAFSQGYYTMKGMADANAYRNEMDALLRDSLDNKVSFMEFQDASASLQQKYLQGSAHDNYALAFAKEAVEVEKHYNRAFTEGVAKQVMEEGKTNIGQAADVRISNIFSTTKDSGEAMRGIRATVDELTDVAKQFHLDKQTVSAIVLQQVGEAAVRQARPDLLSFVDMKDSKGVALTHDPEIQKMAFEWQNKAEAAVRMRQEAAEKAQKKAEEAYDRQFGLALYQAASLSGDEQVAALMSLDKVFLKSARGMSPAAVRAYGKELKDLQELRGFPRMSDPDKVSWAVSKAHTGELSTSDFIILRNTLSADDYIKVRAENSKQASDRAERSRDLTFNTTFDEFKRMRDTGKQGIAMRGPLGNLMNQDDARWEIQYEAMMNNWWKNATTEGKVPSTDEIAAKSMEYLDTIKTLKGGHRGGSGPSRSQGPTSTATGADVSSRFDRLGGKKKPEEKKE